MSNQSSDGTPSKRRVPFLRTPLANTLALGLLLAMVLVSVVAVRTLQPAPPAQSDEGPLLIFHQQKDTKTTSPAHVAENIDFIETLPFDGITVDIPAGVELMRGEPISYNEMYEDGLAPLTDTLSTSRLEHNFVMVYIDDPGDVFDDEVWAITVKNWRNLARAVRDAGLQGIFFDNEEYFQKWIDYPENYDNPQHSLEEYEARTQDRGREIMEAMVDEFPQIELLVFHGPYASEPETPRSVRRNQAGLASERELNGPFFVGLLDGLGPQARLIDGGEVYQYRTVDDFEESYEWRKWGMPSDETDSHFIPDHLRAIWPERVGISFGVYTLRYADEVMDPCIMEETLINALSEADEYVWFYTEEDNWLSPDGIPKIWEEHIRLALETFRTPSNSLLLSACPGARSLASAAPAIWLGRGRHEVV